MILFYKQRSLQNMRYYNKAICLCYKSDLKEIYSVYFVLFKKIPGKTQKHIMFIDINYTAI